MSQSASTVIETARATFDDAPLPHDWRWAKLKDVCIKITDGTHRSPPNGSKGIPYITAKNIRRFKIDLTDLTYVSPEDHAEIYKRCDPKLGDVLYIKDGATMGIAAVNNLDFEFSLLSSVALLRPDPFLLRSFFLAAWLNHPDTYKAVIDTQLGSAIKRMVLSQIVEIQIPIPPIAEQERIEQTLGEQMAAVERARAAAEAQVKATKDLPAAYLRDVFDNSQAQQWKRVKLGELCEVKGGKRLPAGTDFAKTLTAYPYIRVVDFEAGTVNLSNLKYLDESTQRQIARYIIKRDDVYISIAGSIGIVGIIPDELDGANLTENAARLVIRNKELLDRDYLARFLQSTTGKEAIKLRTNFVGQPKLALERIATIEIPLAPYEQQKQIGIQLKERTALAEQACKMLLDQLNAVNKLPAALLRQAFTGKL